MPWVIFVDYIRLNFSYVAWICRAEDLVLAEERTSEADKIKIMEARERQKEKIKKLMGTKKSTESVDTASDDGKEGNTTYFTLSF